MSETAKVDPNAIIRAIDSETLAPITSTGAADHDKTDHLKVTGNGSSRRITLEADNDDATVDDVDIELAGKGAGVVVVPNIPTASLQTAPPEGGICYDATTNKLKVWTGSGYETITSS